MGGSAVCVVSAKLNVDLKTRKKEKEPEGKKRNKKKRVDPGEANIQWAGEGRVCGGGGDSKNPAN